MEPTINSEPHGQRSFLHRALIVAAVAIGAIVLLYFLDRISQILLLFFAGVLMALLLDGGATVLSDHTPLSRRWALAVFCLLLAIVLIALGWFTGGRISGQFDELSRRLPEAWQQFREYAMQWAWVRSLVDNLPQGSDNIDGAMVRRATAVFSTMMGFIGAVLAILFIGIYLAATPSVYTGIPLALLPVHRRDRGRELITALGHALRQWLVARLLSMLVVGVLTWLALWIIGVPLALPLGLIAGLLSFIPYLGPILAAAPGILIGFSEGMDIALQVTLAYIAVQMVEGYLITPLIERRVVRIPPAYQISVQLIGGLLAGFIGILLASPLLVAITVVVQMLYIRDVLGESPDVIGSD